MQHHTAACVTMNFIISKIELICHVVSSIFKTVNSVFYNILVHNLIPSFTEIEMTGCFIVGENDTLIYQTPNPYQNNARCEAEFSCPKSYALTYKFNRFDVQEHSSCYWDHLGILFIHYLSQIE